MGKISILFTGRSCLNLLLLYCSICICCGVSHGQMNGTGAYNYNNYAISSFTYSKTVLKPYEWRYITVNLPPWFSSMTIAFEADVDIDLRSIRKTPQSTLPIICLREGSPPLPDVYNTSLTGLVLDSISNTSFWGVEGLQFVEQCYPMQKTLFVRLTNEQISSGIWYFGLFNGIGPIRTQSKMINRGPTFSFSGNISVEGCTMSTLLGKFCNQTVEALTCINDHNLTESDLSHESYNRSAEDVIVCRNDDIKSCHEEENPRVYSLDVVGIAEKFIISVSNITNGQTPLNKTVNGSNITLMCYARHGALPLKTLHDYSGNISEAPLVIHSPKLGRWYITIQPVTLSNRSGSPNTMRICYSLEWQMLMCPVDKAGMNCTSNRYMLQTVLRKNPSVPFESYYIPNSQEVPSGTANFPVEPLLSNLSSNTWTFLLLDIPSGASGGNIHIRLTSDLKISYEIYAKYGGLPSLDSWDYYYANSSSNSNGSMFFKLYDSKEDTISFYILYVRGGTWGLGLRQFHTDTGSSPQTSMSISLERCPQRCSSHGTCQSVVDTSGLMLYSYCHCDLNHGGVDCSVELVSRRGHMWQSVSLIVSNIAAVLPAYWALRQKAFAEWVLFTSSGISSGLYHACDVGTWCVLSFHVLQFMDFWLSFMAVVSTFVYLATIDELAKRTIHTVVAILTALMAESGPTRSSNIILVMAIGALALLVGWLIEFCTHYRSFSFSTDFRLNLFERWQTVKLWIYNLIKTLLKRFHWGFILAGFIAFAMAAMSWRLETSQNYWIWHSVWHVSIYTSSFLFLCSKAKVTTCESEMPSNGNYELTRQNSFTVGEQGDDR